MSLSVNLDSLTCPEVRDLAWVIGAPGLLSKVGAPSFGAALMDDVECGALLARHWDRLVELDRDPARLLSWLERWGKFRQLGRYFEALLGFWISDIFGAGARRFAHSLCLRRERQVVGELDFVFEEASGRVSHWEAAVKFYLRAAEDPESGRSASSFWGTMTRDNLDKKVALLDRQLQAARSSEGVEALAREGFAAPVSRLLVKGALFYPVRGDEAVEVIDAQLRACPSPPESAPMHVRGWWCRELPAGEAWVELDRMRWLSPFRGPVGFVPHARSEMQQRIAKHFSEERTALMLARVEQGQDGLWRERARGLVVHPGWPWPVT